MTSPDQTEGSVPDQTVVRPSSDPQAGSTGAANTSEAERFYLSHVYLRSAWWEEAIPCREAHIRLEPVPSVERVKRPTRFQADGESLETALRNHIRVGEKEEVTFRDFVDSLRSGKSTVALLNRMPGSLGPLYGQELESQIFEHGSFLTRQRGDPRAVYGRAVFWDPADASEKGVANES